ncbi:MAG: GNAT family N-acetyltransferase [Thermoplasmata archaeon]|nr:GNAT family N-acetyltransferase [Thermoplasmata archaeon]
MVEIRLVPMTEDVYRGWLEGEIREYAEEHVRTGEWSKENAIARSQGEFHTLLPKGIATPGQFLYTLQDPGTSQTVGVVWFQAGVGPRPGEAPKAYVYDIVVRPEFRGKGYGEAAMRKVETEVRERGFGSLGLHVFGHNAVARSLYEKLGYVATNIVMKKTLGD